MKGTTRSREVRRFEGGDAEWCAENHADALNVRGGMYVGRSYFSVKEVGGGVFAVVEYVPIRAVEGNDRGFRADVLRDVVSGFC